MADPLVMLSVPATSFSGCHGANTTSGTPTHGSGMERDGFFIDSVCSLSIVAPSARRIEYPSQPNH